MFLFYFVSALVMLYLYARLSRGITRSSSCLIGKTALLTGANSGIGYQTTLTLASRGCRVIMADVEDMEESKLNIIKYTGNDNIITKKVDLSSLESVRNFAADIVETEPRLDILINNAGIGASAENRTKDGLHPMMQINYFSHFLLTHLLIDLLKKSAPSRIVFTSSGLSFTNNLTCNNLNFNVEKSDLNSIFLSWFIYGNSKLATIIASDIFAEKLKESGVTSNSVHPGLVSTTIFKKWYNVTKNSTLHLFIQFCLKFYSKDPWEGSQVLVHAAVSKSLENVTGNYLSDCKPWFKPRAAYNKKFCQEIWKASEKYVGLKPNEKL